MTEKNWEEEKFYLAMDLTDGGGNACDPYKALDKGYQAGIKKALEEVEEIMGWYLGSWHEADSMMAIRYGTFESLKKKLMGEE